MRRRWRGREFDQPKVPKSRVSRCFQVFYLNFLVLEAKPFRHPGHTPPGHLCSSYCAHPDSSVRFSNATTIKTPQTTICTWEFRFTRACLCFTYELLLVASICKAFVHVSAGLSGHLEATPKVREHDLGFSALHDLDSSDAVNLDACTAQIPKVGSLLKCHELSNWSSSSNPSNFQRLTLSKQLVTPQG